MPSQKSKIIPILIALLGAVIVAAAAVWWLLPGQSLPHSSPSNSSAPAASLDVTLFNRSAYQQLNLQVINNASLPVPPPATIGKANPFL